MRLAASCSLPVLAALIAAPAFAQIRTSTAGDVTNPSGTTLTPVTGSAAVIIDSNNNVTNAGTISATDVSTITGIATSGVRAGSITNTGSISLTESYAATDTNGDGVVDGAFAQGTNRTGISTDGTFTGAINSSGTITIKGVNSAGILAGGPIIGNVTSSGAISVVGDNGYGVRLGAVTGNVAIGGGVSVQGAGSEGVSLAGPITGQVVIHGAVAATGYSSTTLPTTLTSLTPGNLLQGGPAVRIGGSVTGGVLIAGAATTTDTTDADGDGIADANQSAGAIASYGSSPAVLIGSADGAVTIGTFRSTAAGLVNAGGITAAGIYAGMPATAVQIGGLGQPVTIQGGILNSGAIAASANAAQATAIWLTSGATTPILTNSGTISAAGTTASGASARAIMIDGGASLPAIANTGSINAGVALAGGRATAILDASGTLGSVTNTGVISASDIDGTARAIDVSSNTAGFSYVQSQSTSSTTAPSLTGAIVTGTGTASIAASAGAVRSAVTFGAGNGTLALSGTAAFTGSTSFAGSGNRLTLANTASYTGSVDYAGGASTLAIGGSSAFSGTIANGGAVAATVTGGTLGLASTGTTTIGSLALSGGALGITVNPATGTASQLIVTGATTIGAGATVKASVGTLGLTSQTMTILRSGTLSGSGNLALVTPSLPYLLAGSLGGSDASGTVTLTIGRKSATALAFNRSETAAYDAVYAAIVGTASLNTLFTGLTDRDGTIRRYDQMLPDHAGGLFDAVTTGVRLLAPSESAVTLKRTEGLSIWAQQAMWGGRQKSDDTGGYHDNGWGLTAGADVELDGFGRVGASLGYLYGRAKGATESSATINQYQGGVHWIGNWGGLSLTAYGLAALDRLSSTRSIDGTGGTTQTLLTARGKWGGSYFGGGAKIAYEVHAGAFYLRPAGGVTYGRLKENGHDESGGGAGFDLLIDSRTSSEAAATGTLAIGAQLGGDANDPEASTWRFELEGGRRQHLSGSIGATTARFAGGQDFTLAADQRGSGYTGTASASVGTDAFRFVASASADTRPGYRTIAGRVGVRGFF